MGLEAAKLEASRLIESWKLRDTVTRKEGVSDGKPLDEPSPDEQPEFFPPFLLQYFLLGAFIRPVEVAKIYEVKDKNETLHYISLSRGTWRGH